MLNDNGECFYSCVTKEEIKEHVEVALKDTWFVLEDYLRLEKYGLVLVVSKIIKVL